MRFLFLIATLMLSILATEAKAASEDGRWHAEWIPKLWAVASVNGNVVHGDTLSVAIRGESCDMGDVMFNTYTHYKGDDFLALEGKSLKIRFNGTIQNAQVLIAEKFLLGHMAVLRVDYQPLATVKNRLSRDAILTADIVGQDHFFESRHNTWNTKGVVQAIDAARDLCRKNTVATTVAPERCQPLITPPIWAGALKDNDQTVYLDMLRACAAGHEDMQNGIDSLMVSALGALDDVAQYAQKTPKEVAQHVKDTVRVAAEAGSASAQHTYAALHNVDPTGPLAALFPTDQAVFLTWTRKAAAGKEPRALFNLAMRMLPDANAPLPPDPQTAYILLRQISDEIPDQTKLRQTFGPALDEQLDALRHSLGAEKTAQLDIRRKTFDFHSLER